MNPWRAFELRQCLGFVREARAALDLGDLSKASRYGHMATRGVYFVRGLTSATGSLGGTGGLARVIANLEDDIEEAARPSPRVEARELVDEIAEGIRILRTRDACDVTDEQALERARNIAVGLSSRWEFIEIDEANAPN